MHNPSRENVNDDSKMHNINGALIVISLDATMPRQSRIPQLMMHLIIPSMHFPTMKDDVPIGHNVSSSKLE